MTMKPAKMLQVFVDETDTLGDLSLYEAIVRRLVQAGIAGATVDVGIMGFGKHIIVHRKRLFGVSDDRPVTITIVDDEEKIMKLLPELRKLVVEGLILVADVTVVE